MVVAFILLRLINHYGDSQHWEWQYQSNSAEVATETLAADGSELSPASPSNPIDWKRTLFSFLATTKYPPSLLFVLMTLGPALLILAGLERLGNEHPINRFLIVYGRVPLFFYILHFYLLHLGALTLYWIVKGVLISPMQIDFYEEIPPEYGFNGPGWLIQVYVAWLVLLAIMYPACRWYGRAKQQGKSRIWSYF